MNTQRLTLITAAIVAVALIGIIIYSRLQPSPATPTQSNASAELTYDDQPRLGDPDAPVVLAVFEDFKCPACKFFEENVLPQLERDYISSGQAQLYFFNFPFIGPDSTTAAVAGECAYQQNEAAFWEYKTILFRAQGPESQQWATPARLEELANNLGDLDAAALRECTEEDRYADLVASERRLGEDAGVTGTPSLYIDGVKLENANDYSAVQTAIDEALASD